MIVKKQLDMKVGETRKFDTYQELQDFSNKYKFDLDNLEVSYTLVVKKIK